ncbi:hypothetical protein BJ742DRAFT_678587 [Cladochytrium replicatum]|nr:hypothetical protein BJ742DRAFT_678587 [Cladochytrium replicatum]
MSFLSRKTTKALSRSRPSTARTLATSAESAQPSSANIRVGVVLKRDPLTLKEQSPFTRAYYAHRDAQIAKTARPFPADFYFKRGTIAESKYNAAVEELGAKKEGEWVHPFSVLEKVGLQKEELSGLKKRSEVVAENADDVKSLDRSWSEDLFLVVKGPRGWQFIESAVGPEELLHEAASRCVQETCGPLQNWVVGRAPVGHLKATKGSETFHNPADYFAKVFFMRSHLLAGQVALKGYSDYAWLTREQLSSYLEKDNKAIAIEMI